MTRPDYDQWEWRLSDQIRVAGPPAPWRADIALSPQPTGYYVRITAYPEAQPAAAVALLTGPYPAGPSARAMAPLLAAAVVAYWRPSPRVDELPVDQPPPGGQGHALR